MEEDVGYAPKRGLALLLCASMVFGAFFVTAGAARAQVEDAVFNGTVTISGVPAPATLVMYTLTPDGEPAGNATVTDGSGFYEIWVEGGMTYYLYYANGGAMFDASAERSSWIDPGATVTVDADLNPAPASTSTLMGYVTNASNPAEPVTTGHVLGLHMTIDQPDYVNWTVTNSSGYYELNVIPGTVASAVFDAPGYYPGMAPSGGPPPVLGPGDSAWLNISLLPLGAENVFVDGYVRDLYTSLPIVGALVEARLEGMAFTYDNTTDLLGYYTLRTIEGRGEMMASAGGYTSQREYEVYFGGNMTFDWNLTPVNADIHGLVLDAVTMLPIENASVWANSWLSGNRQMYAEDMTAPNGSYQLDISDGGWDVGAEAPGYGRGWDWIWVNPGESWYVELYLTPESSVIKGYVTNSSSGLPIQGVTVRIEGSMTGDNGTSTDAAGYYEINCGPDDYRMMFIANGYMWEMQQSYLTPVGPNETVWVNHTLDPATMRVYGNVSDAVTMAPLDGAEIQVVSFSTYPDYFRVVMTNSMGGQYSARVAPDDVTFIFSGLAGYEDYLVSVDLGNASEFRQDIYMVPIGGTSDEYLLSGYVNDSVSGSPIPNADVMAYYGSDLWPTYVNSTTTDFAGYYSMWVPCMVLSVRASAYSYLPVTATVMPAGAGGSAWQNFTLEPHAVPPEVNSTVDPDENISTVNHADMNATVTEDHLSWVSLGLYWVADMGPFYASLVDIEGYYFAPGSPWTDMPGTEVAPGVFDVGFHDWDTTIYMPVIEDGTGAFIIPQSFWTNWDGLHVSGYYENSSMMGPSGCEVLLNWSYVVEWIDFGSGPDRYAASDPTGTFWMDMWAGMLNLTTGNIEFWNLIQSDSLATATMTIQYDPSTLPTGSYLAWFRAQDLAWLDGDEYQWFTVDNTPPEAAAGPGQTEFEGVDVTLDASGSSDDVGIVTYEWTFDDGGPVTLYGQVVQYAFTTVGNHSVLLTVTDGGGHQASDTTWVDVLVDNPPTAVAGPDQTEDEDVQVDFDGSGSSDDVGIDSYSWNITVASTGAQVALLNGVGPAYTFDTPGVYDVELIVTDTAGQQSLPDVMTVTVNDVTAPVADAGPDMSVGLTSVVTLDGSGSSDNSGSIANYTWTFDDGGPQELYGVAPQYTFSAIGVYNVTLTVTDGAGLSDTDYVEINVTDNVNPVAAAGADVTITLGDDVTFDGSGSTDNVGVVSWTWTFTDGVARTLTGETVTYEFTTAGSHLVTLTVADAEGNTDIDQMTVTVSAANEAPVANAGADQTAAAGEPVTFDGSASTDDNAVTNYTWTFLYGGETQTLYTADPEFTFDEPGSYTVTLTVRDAEGLTDTDTVMVTVTEAEEEPGQTFVEQYWWAIVGLIAAIAVVLALFFIMRKGGPSASGAKKAAPEEPPEDPGPPEDEEL